MNRSADAYVRVLEPSTGHADVGARAPRLLPRRPSAKTFARPPKAYGGGRRLR